MIPRTPPALAAGLLALSTLFAGCDGCERRLGPNTGDASMMDASMTDAAADTGTPPDAFCSPNVVADGEPCEDDIDCLSFRCVATDGGGSICGAPDACFECGQPCEVDADCCHDYGPCGLAAGCFDDVCQILPGNPC